MPSPKRFSDFLNGFIQRFSSKWALKNFDKICVWKIMNEWFSLAKRIFRQSSPVTKTFFIQSRVSCDIVRNRVKKCLKNETYEKSWDKTRVRKILWKFPSGVMCVGDVEQNASWIRSDLLRALLISLDRFLPVKCWEKAQLVLGVLKGTGLSSTVHWENEKASWERLRRSPHNPKPTIVSLHWPTELSTRKTKLNNKPALNYKNITKIS